VFILRIMQNINKTCGENQFFNVTEGGKWSGHCVLKDRIVLIRKVRFFF
jgi:hypothetical protein